MAQEGGGGGASEGSAHTQQPGVTPQDLGTDDLRVSPEDLNIMPADEVAAPPAAPDHSTPMVNADLVDDPDELARTIEEASGQSVEVVSESDHDADR